jgi:hypothetical protein
MMHGPQLAQGRGLTSRGWFAAGSKRDALPRRPPRRRLADEEAPAAAAKLHPCGGDCRTCGLAQRRVGPQALGQPCGLFPIPTAAATAFLRS